MRILLINPPTPDNITNKEYYVPSSLLYLAAVLQKADVEVNILDLNIYHPEKYDNPAMFCENIIVDKISDYEPSLVGIGCLFSGQFSSVLNYSKKIKRFFESINIVIGGIHPTIYFFEILTNCPSIDWVIIGEAEESIIALVDMLKEKRYDFDKIDGFAYRENGEVIVNPKKCFISDLDGIPFPAYDLINLKDYYHDTTKWHNPRKLPINASLPILTSRSCPMRCCFCSMFLVMGTKWRKRSAKNVVDEMEFLYKKYGHRHFSFMDDNLTINKKHILAICDEIAKRKMNIQFETPNGISTLFLDGEILDALVTAGLVRVSLAIESGSDYIRNQVMGKKLPREKIFEIVRLTKKYKELYVRAFFIMGMPEDNRETLDDTYKMIEEIDVDKPIVSNLLPFPGTRLFDQALKDKLFVGDLDADNLWEETRFFFTDNKRFFIKPYDLELSELQEYRKKFDDLIEKCVEKQARIRKGFQYEIAD